MPDSPVHSAANFADIAQQLLKAHTLQQTLQRIVELSVDVIEPCDSAAISLSREGEVVTPVWTDPAALEMDASQYRSGEGPCLDAIRHRASVYAGDISSKKRWPKLAPKARAAGVGSVLSLRLGTDEMLGALNLYARQPAAYSDEDVARGDVFASHAGLALEVKSHLERTIEALDAERLRVEKLEVALLSRDVIGQAKGVLMHRHRIIADRAFDELRGASQRLNIKLRDIAQRVVDTGELPQNPF